MLFIFMTPFVAVVLFPNSKGRDIWLLGWYIFGGPPSISPTHPQGEQEKEKQGQGPQQSFIILNARKEEERKGRKKGENTNPIMHTTEWGWYENGTDVKLRHGVGPWGRGQRNAPHSFLSLMLFSINVNRTFTIMAKIILVHVWLTLSMCFHMQFDLIGQVWPSWPG